MKNNNYMINGCEVIYTYAGIDQYTVYRDGKEVGTCWDLDSVAKWTNTHVETVKEEMWKQR